MKIQTRALVPVLREERANQLVADALRDWSRVIYRRSQRNFPDARPHARAPLRDARPAPSVSYSNRSIQLKENIVLLAAVMFMATAGLAARSS